MNVYLIKTWNDEFCIRAENMALTAQTAINLYIAELCELELGDVDKSKEIEHYHRKVLKSITLVGRLEN